MHRLPLCVLFACASAAAQTLTFVEGTPTSATVLTLPEGNPTAVATVVLQDVELLAIEITGRVLGQENDPTRSRVLDRHGVSRVELPDGGRLLRYSRSSGSFWGFLHVAADGTPRIVLELPGAGAADPFGDRIGVAPDGSFAAVPRIAGGLYVVRLDGGVYASTGLPARLIAPGAAVQPPSVMVGSQAVWFQNNANQQYRCFTVDGAVPVDVSAPPVPNGRLKEQVAMSGDGSRIVFLYGTQQQGQLMQRLWTVDLTGGAVALPPPPSKYEEPSYLPDGPGEPAMLLNGDGTRLFFVDADVRDELYMLDTTGALPMLQITADPIFEPYIGVHVLPRFSGNRMLIAIGDMNALDWYHVDLTAGGGAVANLTATGSPTQPFVPGTLDPVNAARAGADWLVAEQLPTTLRLRRIDPASGAQVAVVQDALAPPLVGTSFAGAPDVTLHAASGDRLFAAGAVPLFQLPPGLVLAAPAVGPDFAAVWIDVAFGFGISAFYLPNGTFVTGPFESGVEQICATQSGGAVMVGDPVRYVALGVYIVLGRPTVPFRRCLSGGGV